MSTTAIIQARMGSTRLPGKVLADLGGETVLARVISRLKRARYVHQLVVATTESPSDDAIFIECKHAAVPCYRGSEHDVLDRFYRAAGHSGADTIVRITADCPLIDPQLVDKVIQLFHDERPDYASNILPRTFPRGLDVEVFSKVALDRAWRETAQPHEREHVTPYFYEHPNLFRLGSFKGSNDYSIHRWTIDTAEDLQLVRWIYSRFGNQDTFGWEQVLSLVESEPSLGTMNSQVAQKPLHAS